MPEIQRKQLNKSPEENINYISAMEQWYEFVVDYTDVQTAATTNTITLATLPAKSWIHAVHWKITTAFGSSHAYQEDGNEQMVISIGDEDNAGRWLDDAEILFNDEGSEGSNIIEDAIGFIPWEPDFDNIHDLEVEFIMNSYGSTDLNDLTAGVLKVWFLLSSMDLS